MSSISVIERTTSARIDRSDLARVVVGGPERRDFLQRLVTNDVSGLSVGRGVPTLLLERTGRVVDRVIVADRGDDFLLVGSSGRGPDVAGWFEKYIIADDVTCTDVAGESRLLTVCGPRAVEMIEVELGVAAGGFAPWEHRALEGKVVRLMRAENVGGKSFHLIGPPAAVAAVEEVLAELPRADAARWHELRVAAGVPAFGTEFDEGTVPLEARMTDAISFTKGCYVGQEVIARVNRYDRVKRALVRLRIEAADPPAPGDELLDGDEKVGVVTSAARDEAGSLALGYVAVGRESPGTRLSVAGAVAEVLSLTPDGDPA
jgi:aminomethyltransferase